jgi:hypothetical protein
MDIYQENGYKNREEYLHALAVEYGIELATVLILADILGQEEDFDGLVVSLQDAETQD